ncbi:recombinase family protein [Streptomyces sp. NPDC051907]|uniref:recombinase family protein n=1 Tax=Streptomyces sp. NPDC051907 TaxID=3155284 RepID=UPI00342BEDDD
MGSEAHSAYSAFGLGDAGLGVPRHEEDCRTLCARMGSDAVSAHPDNDVSADSGAPRPARQEPWAAVGRGDVDAVAVWHVDRLTCSPRELKELSISRTGTTGSAPAPARRHGRRAGATVGSVSSGRPRDRRL